MIQWTWEDIAKLLRDKAKETGEQRVIILKPDGTGTMLPLSSINWWVDGFETDKIEITNEEEFLNALGKGNNHV